MPTEPGKIDSAGMGRNDGANVAVPTCRCSWIVLTDESGKTVRSPFVPSANVTAPPWSCARIFREIASMLCVVKRLASAIWLGVAPPAIAVGSASSSALR